MSRRLGLLSACFSIVLVAGLLVLASTSAGTPRTAAAMADMSGMAMGGSASAVAVRVSRCIGGQCVDLRLVQSADGLTAVDGPAADGATDADGPAVATNTVRIVNFAFQPMTLTVPLSTTVTWTNTATNTSHTTTSDTGLWDSGVLAPNQSFHRKFTTTGTFRYHCSIHPFMKGAIVVKSP
jgi:plastocyanin